MAKILMDLKNINEVNKVEKFAITHQVEAMDARPAAVEKQQLQADSSKVEALLLRVESKGRVWVEEPRLEVVAAADGSWLSSEA